jgi:tetratricopeptide (TPR) repeat protein
VSPGNPEGPEGSLALARHFLTIDRPERALEALGLVEEAAALPEAWGIRGRALMLLGRHAEAAQALQRGLGLSPTDTELLYLLAFTEKSLGNLAAAERHLLEALRIAPTSAVLLASYAELVARAGQFAKARGLLQRAEEIDPECTSLLRVRTVVASLEGRDREAVRHARSWVAERPDDARAHVTAAAMHENAGRPDIGFRHAREAVTLDARVADGDVEWLRQQRLMSHWAMVPLRPVARFGPATVWGCAVAILIVLRALEPSWLAATFAGLYILFVIYTWAVPPIVRRIIKRRSS